MYLSNMFPALFVLSFLAVFTEGKKIFCYYSSFAQTRQGIGSFLPEDINPHLCTHIIYAFVDITPDGRGLRPFNRNDQGPKGLYARTMALKERNPSLKVLLAVGGWQIGSKPFMPMVKDADNRRVWIENVVAYLRKHGFDGLDMDWEFPATRGSPPEDKYRFTLLMKGLYEAFAREAEEYGREKLLLTMATASGTYYIDQSYEPREIIRYIDYMLLMTYNYHGQWEKITGHHSGLYRHKHDPKTGEKSQLYQQWSIDFWLDMGVPKSKLVIGLPTYGMSFTLADKSHHGVHAPASGGGEMGEYTKETGILAYYEVCLALRNKDWQSEWIDDQAVPYAFGGDQWVGYENRESIKLKANNIKSRDLAGAFVWSLEMDDYRGTCGEGDYPLLSTVHNIIGGQSHVNAAAARPHFKPSFKLDSIKHDHDNLKRNRHFRKPHRLHRWHKSTTVQPEPEEAQTATTPQPIFTKPSTQRYTKSDQGRLHVTWWKGSLARKPYTWRPRFRPAATMHKPIAHKHRPAVHKHKPARTWTRKVIRKNNEVSNLMAKGFQSNEIHDVDNWETSSWWSSAAEGGRPGNPFSGITAAATGRPGMGVQKITPVTPMPKPHTHKSTTRSSAAAAAESGFCNARGIGTFADPRSCDQFIICMPGQWQDYAPHIMSCPAGTRFDADLKICNYASRVKCGR